MKFRTFLATALMVVLFAATPLAMPADQSAGEKKLGAFEITALQRDMAAKNTAGYPVLDAGRGNPNWINAHARLAFARLMQFAVTESQLTFSHGDLAGQARKDGIGARFDAAMKAGDPVDKFLLDAVAFCVKKLGLNKDALLKELVDGITGDYYPSPSRVLVNTEKILNAYLEATIMGGTKTGKTTRVFPTEGGSAAMCYIFSSLTHNRVLKPGDKIAIGTPIFTPYLQIPEVMSYDLVSINVESTVGNGWDVPEAELAKLEDKSVKAFFLVNPSNPASHALSKRSLDRLKRVVKKNPDLIILTDDVYGTFVDGFRSVYAALPHNTILVYSFSKLYGVTGWRVGLVAMNEKNVIDRIIARLPQADKDFLNKEYSIVVHDPASMPFVERLTADSRSIGLYHTSGLSTPQQVFMDILALTHLVPGKKDPYIEQCNEVVRSRYNRLMQALGLAADNTPANARYYALVELDTVARRHGGDAFGDWFAKNVDEIDFLNDLAGKKGVVLMYGPGFSSPDHMARVSLANLEEKDYAEIARRMFELLDEYKAGPFLKQGK